MQADRVIPGQEMYGETISVTHADYEPSEFDELVIGRWLHLEQMDTGLWWMSVAGVTVHVRADRDGNPLKVWIESPGALAVPGCSYEIDGEPA